MAESAEDESLNPSLRRTMKAALLLLVFLSVFGSKAWMIREFGSSIPYWDQWGGESSVLLAAQQGTLKASQLWEPHNEHRIVIPRLFSLALFALNCGQWDNLPALYAMAAVSAASITMLLGIYLGLTGWRHWQVIVPISACLYAMPLTWLNMLWGFQSQFHFQLLFGIAALAGLGLGRPWGAAWWVGAVAALCAMFTSGSEFLLAASILFLLGIRTAKDRRFDTASLPTVVLSIAILLAGVLLVPHVDDHDRLKAASPAEFATAAMKNFAWPWHEAVAPSLILYLPILLLLIRYLSGEKAFANRSTELLILLGSSAAVQLFAIAFCRGINGLAPHARYFDIHLLGLVTNLLALDQLLPGPHGGKRVAAFSRAGTAIWLAVVFAGCAQLSIRHFTTSLPDWKAAAKVQTDNVLDYLSTGAPEHILDRQRLEVPHGSPKLLLRELSRPGLADILPAALHVSGPPDTQVREGTFTNEELPASAGMLPARLAVFSSYAEKGGEGSLVTDPIASRRPWLLLWYCGHRAKGKLQLNLLDDGNHLIRRIQFPEGDLPEDRRGWRTVITSTPGIPFKIEALDQRTQGWFAFTEPLQIGSLSALAIRFGDAGQPTALVAFPLLLALAAIGIFEGRAE